MWGGGIDHRCIKNFFGTLSVPLQTTILWLSGLCMGQPWWAGTGRNIHPLTPIMVSNHPLSASSIFYDPWHPPCSIYVPDSLFPQSLSKFSLVYLLAWHPPLHIPYRYIPSPNHCLLFAAHAHTIATCFAVVPRLRLASNPSFCLNSLLGTLSCSFMPHIHLTILISALWSGTSFSFLTGQVSLPCNIPYDLARKSKWSHKCNKKWKSAHDKIGRCLGYSHAEADSDRLSRLYPVVPNSTEEDQWGVENVAFCATAACVRRLACRSISAHVELLVIGWSAGLICKLWTKDRIVGICRLIHQNYMCPAVGSLAVILVN